MTYYPSPLLLPLLALATYIPPHGRVNFKCFSIWNADRTNLEIMWNGNRHSQPWTFNKQVNGIGCGVDECVQRLWCTDSGAIGYYNKARSYVNVPLYYTWLYNTQLRGETVLAAPVAEGSSTIATWSNYEGQGTVLVMGDTLYFYSYQYFGRPVPFSLPRLSALVFAEYEPGRTADELVRRTLAGFDVLGYAGDYAWTGSYSPIYPAGRDALTISIEDSDGSPTPHTWAIDVALSVAGSAVSRLAFVHLPAAELPSVYTSSREAMTVVGFACRVFADATPGRCHQIPPDGGTYTWAWDPVAAMGMDFAPLRDLASFALPAALWLPLCGGTHRIIATYGLGSIIAFNGGYLYGVEQRPSPDCSSGSGLFLVTYATAGNEIFQADISRRIGCANEDFFYASPTSAVPYQATVVKWLGPFAATYPLFVASRVSESEYCPLDASLLPACEATEYIDERCSCAVCPGGHWCDGKKKTPCATGTYAAGGASSCTPCAAGTYSSGQASACTPCDDGSYAPDTGATVCAACSGGAQYTDAAHTMCLTCEPGSVADASHRSCAECAAGSAAVDGECRPCDPGTVSSAGAASCAPCETGSYQPSPGQTRCLPCPAGTFCGTAGATSQDACAPCALGHHSQTGAAECSACTDGSYADTTGAEQCKPCDGGDQYTDAGHSQCLTCPDGQTAAADHKSCAACRAGTAETASGTCTECLLGTFSAAGAAVCTPCAPGTHAPAPGAGSCTPCRPGFTSLSGASACVVCPAGFACPGGAPPAVCDLDLGEGAQACVPCRPESVWLNGSCVACAALPTGLVCEERGAGEVHHVVRRKPGAAHADEAAPLSARAPTLFSLGAVSILGVVAIACLVSVSARRRKGRRESRVADMVRV